MLHQPSHQLWPPLEVVACAQIKFPYLSPRNRVLQQRQMRQFREMPQGIEIGEFGEVVGREDEGGEIGYRSREGGLDTIDSVAREEEGAQAGRKREVGEDGDVVIGEVDGILILQDCHSSVHVHRVCMLSGRKTPGWWWGGGQYFRDAQVLDGGDFVAYGPLIMISMELARQQQV